MALAYLTTVVSVLVVGAVALDNGLGLKPPMGYNTWNDLGPKISEELVRARADAMVAEGFLEAGYEYLNMDDGWSLKERHPETGELQPDPAAFPSGIKALADYVHDKGLKLGIYTDRGTLTCAGRAGSYGHEKQDAETFAQWEVDYLKNDNCHAPGGANNHKEALLRFTAMRDGLNATGRPIFYSVCAGGGNIPFISDLTWYARPPFGGAVANAWRISADVGAPLGLSWATARHSIARNMDLSEYAGPGGWNDPDMLLGSNTKAAHHLTSYQTRTQFSLWAIMSAPLMIGAPLADLSAEDKETFLNKELIAINQDSLAKQAVAVAYDQPFGLTPVFARQVEGGGFVMVMINNHPWRVDVKCDAACWEKVEAQTGVASGSELDVRDLWTHAPADPTAVHKAGDEFSVGIDGTGHSRTFKFTPKQAERVTIL